MHTWGHYITGPPNIVLTLRSALSAGLRMQSSLHGTHASKSGGWSSCRAVNTFPHQTKLYSLQHSLVIRNSKLKVNC